MLPPVRVYISSAAPDRGMAQCLSKRFAAIRTPLIETFFVVDMPPGSNAREVREQRVKGADVFVPLLSVDYFVDDACKVDLANAIARYRERAISIVPVGLRACSWHLTELGHLRDKVTPLPGRDLNLSVENDDPWWSAVHAGILASACLSLARQLPNCTHQEFLDIYNHDGVKRDGGDHEIPAGLPDLDARAWAIEKLIFDMDGPQRFERLVERLRAGWRPPARTPDGNARIVVLLVPQDKRYLHIVLTIGAGKSVQLVYQGDQYEEWTDAQRARVRAAIGKAIASLGVEYKQSRICVEFVLPHELLWEEVEGWNHSGRRSGLLGIHHPTIVRSANRWLDPLARGFLGEWRANWDRHCQVAAHAPVWIDSKHPPKVFGGECCVGIRDPLRNPLGEHEIAVLDELIIDYGTPVVVWLRAGEDSMEDAQQTLLALTPISAGALSPETGLALRRAAATASESDATNAPETAANRMVLLWDEPDATLLSWLGSLRRQAPGTKTGDLP